MKCYRLMILGICVLLGSCVKTNLNSIPKLYVRYSIDTSEYIIDGSQTKYTEYYTKSNSLLKVGYSDNTFYLEGWSQTPLNIVYFSFLNIPFDSIQPGLYDYFSNETSKSDHPSVSIVWMAPEIWYGMVENYKKTENYANCALQIGEQNESVCYNDMRNENDFLLTTNAIQKGSYFEISDKYDLAFHTIRECDQKRISFKRQVIEGTFKCITKSSFDTTTCLTITGAYRIPLTFDIPNDCK